METLIAIGVALGCVLAFYIAVEHFYKTLGRNVMKKYFILCVVVCLVIYGVVLMFNDEEEKKRPSTDYRVLSQTSVAPAPEPEVQPEPEPKPEPIIVQEEIKEVVIDLGEKPKPKVAKVKQPQVFKPKMETIGSGDVCRILRDNVTLHVDSLKEVKCVKKHISGTRFYAIGLYLTENKSVTLARYLYAETPENFKSILQTSAKESEKMIASYENRGWDSKQILFQSHLYLYDMADTIDAPIIEVVQYAKEAN